MNLELPLTDDQSKRALAAYGVALNLGRDATTDEVVAELVGIVRDRTLAVETNVQAALVPTKVMPW